MSQPSAYIRTKNFLDNTSDRTDHQALNDEFDRVSTSITGTRTSIALLQADDGTLRPATVGVTQLTSTAQAELSRPGIQGVKGDDGLRGIQGIQGVEGPIGSSFDADVRGLASEIGLYADRPAGFSFLAMDTGLLFFKLSDVVGSWSQGFVYGKGEKGEQGIQGGQGIQGERGLRGLQGLRGVAGDQGIQGPAGTVDYTNVIRANLAATQSLAGELSAPSFAASGIVKTPSLFLSNTVRLRMNNGRLSVDDAASQPTLLEVEAQAYRSGGTGAQVTGYKLSTGADIGTLFDPSGSSADKLTGVDPTIHTISLAGKTSITAALSVVNNVVQLSLTAS